MAHEIARVEPRALVFFSVINCKKSKSKGVFGSKTAAYVRQLHVCINDRKGESKSCGYEGRKKSSKNCEGHQRRNLKGKSASSAAAAGSCAFGPNDDLVGRSLVYELTKKTCRQSSKIPTLERRTKSKKARRQSNATFSLSFDSPEKIDTKVVRPAARAALDCAQGKIFPNWRQQLAAGESACKRTRSIPMT